MKSLYFETENAQLFFGALKKSCFMTISIEDKNDGYENEFVIDKEEAEKIITHLKTTFEL